MVIAVALSTAVYATIAGSAHDFSDGTGWQAWPFDKEFYLILNIAVGGNWGGAQGVDPNIWPQRMEVDYVRVYAPVYADE